MRNDKISKVTSRKKTVTKVMALALLLLVVLIVLVLLLAPVLVSSGKGRQIILARINSAVAGRTDFADLSMGWFKGIKVADFSFNDNAGQISVQVGQISTKPHYGSLLTGNLSFGQTLIDRPRVEINLKKPQVAKAAPSRQEPAGGRAVQPVVLPVQQIELVVNDGNVKVTDAKSGTVEVSQINSKLNLQPPGRQTDFDLRMAVAQAGKPSEIHVASQVTPAKQTGWSLKGTTGDLTVEVNDLDIESLGPFLALAGVEIQAKGLVRGQVKGQIKDGLIENLDADVKAKNLDVTGSALKGDRVRTSELAMNAAMSQGKGTINIQSLQVKTDWASASASGTLPTTFKSLGDLLGADSATSLKGDFNCDVAAVLSQMPKTLGLKEGTKVTSGTLTGNVATATQAGQKQIRASATLAGLGGAVEGKKIALSEPIKAEASVSSGKAGINFDKIDVSAPFAKINCAGSAESITYNADADLMKLQLELGQFVDFGKYKLAGAFASKGQVSIGPDKIAATASSVLTNLRVDAQDGNSVSEPKAQIDITVALDKKTNVLALNSVIARTSFGQFGVKDGAIPLNKDSTQPLRLAPSVSNLDLAKLRPFAVMLGSVPKDLQFAGILESEMKVTVQNNTYHIVTDKTNIKNLELVSPGKVFKQSNTSIVADVETNPTDKTYSAKLNLLADQIKGFINVSNVKKNNQIAALKGTAELEYDWTAVTAVVAPYLPEGLTLQGKRKDAINFLSEYPIGKTDQLMANLNAKGKVGFEKAGYMGLDFGVTNVDIQIDGGLLKIAPFTTTVNEGQLSFASQTDFKQTPALFKTPQPMQVIKDIKINDATTKQLLKYVSPIFANAVNVSGIANLSCEQLAIPLSAQAKKDAVVIGTISISDLRLQSSDLLGEILTTVGTGATGTVLTLHPTKFVLKDGFLRYDDMQIDVGDNPINFKGVIGLDKSLDMTVTLPYTSEGRTARVGRETTGRRITLPLKGTVDAPKLDTGKLIEDQLKGQIEDQVLKGLDKIFK